MRKMLTMAAAMAVALPVSLAGATKPLTPPGKSNPYKITKPRPKPCKPAKKSGVTYIIRGVITGVTETTISVDVKSVNKHGKRALEGITARGGGMYDWGADLTVTRGTCTYITRRGKGPSKRAWSSIAVNDRVVMAWKAARNTAYVDLGPVRRVVDQGPKH